MNIKSGIIYFFNLPFDVWGGATNALPDIIIMEVKGNI